MKGVAEENQPVFDDNGVFQGVNTQFDPRTTIFTEAEVADSGLKFFGENFVTDHSQVIPSRSYQARPKYAKQEETVSVTTSDGEAISDENSDFDENGTPVRPSVG